MKNQSLMFLTLFFSLSLLASQSKEIGTSQIHTNVPQLTPKENRALLIELLSDRSKWLSNFELIRILETLKTNQSERNDFFSYDTSKTNDGSERFLTRFLLAACRFQEHCAAGCRPEGQSLLSFMGERYEALKEVPYNKYLETSKDHEVDSTHIKVRCAVAMQLMPVLMQEVNHVSWAEELNAFERYYKKLSFKELADNRSTERSVPTKQGSKVADLKKIFETTTMREEE